MAKYIKNFKTESAYESYIGGGEAILPNVSLVTESQNVYYNPNQTDWSKEYLTFEITSDGYVNWVYMGQSGVTIEYSKNGGEWTEITALPPDEQTYKGATIDVLTGDIIKFRGDNNVYVSFDIEQQTFTAIYGSFAMSTCGFELKGNIMSIIDSVNFKNKTIMTQDNNGAFIWLFFNCPFLTDASNLILPAMTLAEGCYLAMFSSCMSLTTTPVLPATILARSCYSGMFAGCTSLTTAPSLPATTLTQSCYDGMFGGCTSLATAPELPATTLAEGCYSQMFSGCTALTTAPSSIGTSATTMTASACTSMFQGCTSLTTAPSLPATTLAEGCYSQMFSGCASLATAPSLPATTLTQSCYDGMFGGCTSLATAPELPATTLASYCYSSMFDNCTSLTTAPVLPATTLANYCYSGMFIACESLTTAPELSATTLTQSCYDSMFRSCTSLEYIKCLATNISATNCTSNWVNGVASTGTFVKASSMSSWTTGVWGIPENWAVQDA